MNVAVVAVVAVTAVAAVVTAVVGVRGRRVLVSLLCGMVFGFAMPASPAWAHAFAPALLELKEVAAGQEEVALRFKQPAVRAAGSSLRPVLPVACAATSGVILEEAGTGVVASQNLRCEGGLVGQRLGVAGIAASQANVLLRVELADGRSMRHVLTADRPNVVVPERQGLGQLLTSYGALGFEHILGGYDHLFFVLALVLLVGMGWRLVRIITAFTLGHSVTLALAALGVLAVPQAFTEVLIAASLLVLAVELTRPAAERWGGRGAFALAAGFGLLHGLGFAGALREVGLPAHDVPAALLGFNLGIEVGQLAFVVVVVALGALIHGLVAGRFQSTWAMAAARAVPVYGLGIAAAYWTLERIASACGWV